MFLAYTTAGFKGYSVQYSPFVEHRLACAAAANFGLVGNGRLYILDIALDLGGVHAVKLYDTQDGLFDLAWSEVNEYQLVTASGDGSIKLWDVNVANHPLKNWAEHTREVFSVQWNLINKETFVTASWDHTIKIWHPEQPRSLDTLRGHEGCVYEASWSPHHAETIASASGDRTVRVWDTRRGGAVGPAQTIGAHVNEVLSLDWTKYAEHEIATGSVDHSVKVWDLRRPDREVSLLLGHDLAVRKVKCSPHAGNVLATASYDMTARFWDARAGVILDAHEAHTEFVLGLDFNLYVEGQVATCSWDENVHIFTPRALQSPTPYLPLGTPQPGFC